MFAFRHIDQHFGSTFRRAMNVRSGLCALVLSVAALSVPAGAGEVVHIVVPAPPGGDLDVTARALGQRLGELTGDSYVVENRPGANTAIGTEYVVRAAADGNVWLYNGAAMVVYPWLQKMSFSPLEDLRPVVQISRTRYVLVVAPESAIGSARDLVKYAAQLPQGLNCAAAPGPMGMACDQLAALTGRKVTSVPFGGIAPAVQALMGGHVDLMFVSVAAVEPLIRTAKLRVIAASSSAAGGNVPLIGELWPGFVLEGFTGLLVPAKTAPEKISQINAQVNRVLREPQFSAALRDAGQEEVGGTAEQYSHQLNSTYRRYGELVRNLGLDTRPPN